MPAKIKDLIKDLIAHKYEEEWFEFKVNWFEPKILGEYISALSNAAALTGRKYAYLIWGIDDKTHKVVGTDFDYHRNVKNEPLPHFLARQMNPDIAFQFLETTFQEKRLVILVIPAAKKAPTAFDKTRFLRIGSSKIIEIYGEKTFEFREKSIVVTIQFSNLDSGSTTQDNTQVTTQVNVPVKKPEICNDQIK